MNLFIVESPGKVKKIQQFLGTEYKVMASVGHVRDLPIKEMGLEPPEFRPKYVQTDRGKQVLAKLAAAAKSASCVFLATDPDREGEAIAWHLEDALRLKGAKRITYTEITETAIKAALGKARSIDKSLVAAQEGRRVLDRLVGYMVSPAISDQAGQRLSAGRVQSPSLRLVVEREREIRNFKVTVHYGVELIFESVDNITSGWKAVWQPRHGWLAEGQEYILDKAVAERVATLRNLKVLDCQESESQAAPPAPFITSTLQQAASSSLKLSPKKTMELAQKLYEGGHITYMRTDSPNLSEEAIAEIRSWASQHDLPLPASSRTWKSKAGAQEAHEAIRPTHFEIEEAGDSDQEKTLYRMIRLRAIASQLEDAVFAVRIVSLEGELDGKSARFEAKGRTLTRPGWKALVAADQTEDPEAEPDGDSSSQREDNPVPALDPGRIATVRETKLLTKKTKPLARFSEASLIRELERRGIGRPSTYAAILDNITSREYLKIEKRFLVPTSTGEKVVDVLAGRFGFLDYDFTTRLEDELDQVAEGKTEYLTVVTAAHRQINNELRGFVDTTSHKCPDCGKPLRHMMRADSKEKKGYDFWSCSGYPDCKVTFDSVDGKPGTRRKKKAPAPASEFNCPDCGKPLIHRTGNSKAGKPYGFFSCSGFPKCKSSFNTKDDKPDFDRKK
ncbi:MAG: type I DNA topoisomerase [Desulfocapsaceae bacterium]|nr:type I DNA topoisomerase [Desulfocapsaceae bacterium]